MLSHQRGQHARLLAVRDAHGPPEGVEAVLALPQVVQRANPVALRDLQGCAPDAHAVFVQALASWSGGVEGETHPADLQKAPLESWVLGHAVLKDRQHLCPREFQHTEFVKHGQDRQQIPDLDGALLDDGVRAQGAAVDHRQVGLEPRPHDVRHEVPHVRLSRADGREAAVEVHSAVAQDLVHGVPNLLLALVHQLLHLRVLCYGGDNLHVLGLQHLEGLRPTPIGEPQAKNSDVAEVRAALEHVRPEGANGLHVVVVVVAAQYHVNLLHLLCQQLVIWHTHVREGQHKLGTLLTELPGQAPAALAEVLEDNILGLDGV
mmetsp:Transcript_44698/g.138357  ORF Transcript_44698/g.138357 Transcript_44698/m.138357 type:complete len:319 (+) Transcript_44698:245-1201(+)